MILMPSAVTSAIITTLFSPALTRWNFTMVSASGIFKMASLAQWRQSQQLPMKDWFPLVTMSVFMPTLPDNLCGAYPALTDVLTMQPALNCMLCIYESFDSSSWINFLMSATDQAETFGLSFFGFGNSPFLTPAHHRDRLKGRTSRTLGSLMKPSSGSVVYECCILIVLWDSLRLSRTIEWQTGSW